MLESLVDTIGDGPVVEERGVDLVDAGDDVVESAHVEERLLLTGERGFREIFRSRRRAHGHGNVLAVAQTLPGVRDGVA